MGDQRKMIIITTDEDLIEQFSREKSKDMHIIDLDDDDQIINTNDRDLANKALLATLSKLNSNPDQISKRARDSHEETSSKSNKTSKKSNELICVVCGYNAIGYNYDVLSCGSCKAFFRRNAHQNLEKMRCLRGDGQCSIEHSIRRKCSKCRLERCFIVGMKKEFLLSEEEKQRRQQNRLEKNRTTTTFHRQSSPSSLDEIDRLISDDENPSLNNLSVDEWFIIGKLRTSFLTNFEKDQSQRPCTDAVDRSSALIAWSYAANQSALRVIDFLDRLDEFRCLNADDRFLLVKYNIFPLYPLLKSFDYDEVHDCCSFGNEEELAKLRRFYLLCFGIDGHHESFLKLVISIVQVTEQDPRIIALILIILMFYEGLSMNEDKPLFNDLKSINRAQSYYTTILWKYMIEKWNEEETWKRFIRFLPVSFAIESSARRYRGFFRDQLTQSDSVDKLAPLVQSLLCINTD